MMLRLKCVRTATAHKRSIWSSITNVRQRFFKLAAKRMEASAMFYSLNTFSFHSIYYTTTLTRLLAWLDVLRPETRGLLRRILIHYLATSRTPNPEFRLTHCRSILLEKSIVSERLRLVVIDRDGSEILG